MSLTVTIPGMRLRSPNAMRGTTRGARMAAARAAAAERTAGSFNVMAACRTGADLKRLRLALPVVVTITRVAPRPFDDDNLAASGKHVRDGIADALRIDDRSPLVTWRYAQRRGPAKTYAIEIRIEPREDFVTPMRLVDRDELAAEYPADVPEMVEQAL
jgi:hypothetical protein